MSLPQLITLVYLTLILTFTRARVCDVTCPEEKYYDEQSDGCRPCSELCTDSYEDRVVDCNNLCRSHCNNVTAIGYENTKCFGAAEWEAISQKHSLPCSKCCEADNQVCSQQMGQCEDCSSFCRVRGGHRESCYGYCRGWCGDLLGGRDWTADEEQNYGLCRDVLPPLQLLKMYKEQKTISKETTSQEMTGSAEGPNVDDEDFILEKPESRVVSPEEMFEKKTNSTVGRFEDRGFVKHDGSEQNIESADEGNTTKGNQFEPRHPSGTVVKREESFSTQWLLWIIGGCAILILLVNGILLAVMLKQRTKPHESHQSATHTNHMYGTSIADEEKKKLMTDIESQSSESMGGGSRSRCESEQTEKGDTEEISPVSAVVAVEGKKGEGEEDKYNTEVDDTYSYIHPEASRKAAAGSSDVV